MVVCLQRAERLRRQGLGSLNGSLLARWLGVLPTEVEVSEKRDVSLTAL
jgi:hypothetical protein